MTLAYAAFHIDNIDDDSEKLTKLNKSFYLYHLNCIKNISRDNHVSSLYNDP